MFPVDTELDTKVTLESESMPIAEDEPFHILMLGNWSGDKFAANVRDSLVDRLTPVEIDRDNFDDVLGKFKVKLELDFAGEENLTIDFNNFDDFHPDNLFSYLPVFSELKKIRRNLLDSKTFNEAAGQFRIWLSGSDSDMSENVVNKLQPDLPDEDNLLDRILTGTNQEESPLSSQNTVTKELSSFVKDIVAPHLIHIDLTEQKDLLEKIDEIISGMMRKIIHHPKFQALESAWRGLYFLTRRAETDRNLKIFLLDIDKNSLTEDLKSYENLQDTDYFQFLNQDQQDNSWAIICGNYFFELNVDDVAALVRLAKISSFINAPFMAGVLPASFGVSKSSERNFIFSEDSAGFKLWNALRSISESEYLALSIPRFMIRMPFGDATESAETFSFEEFREFGKLSALLWTNPVFICALVFADSYSKFGWSYPSAQQIDNLPTFSFVKDGETFAESPTEIVFSEKTFRDLVRIGLIPLLNFKNSDFIRIDGLHPVAPSLSELKGKWAK